MDAKAARAHTKQLDRMLQADFQKKRKQIRLLLLGAGESGKSTIVKQMQILYRSGWKDEERREWKKIIHSNILASAAALVAGAQKLKITVRTEAAEELSEFCSENGITEDAVDNFIELTPELVQQVVAIWNDAGIQAAYARSSEFHLNASAAYYLKELDRIARPDYLPTDQDLLRCRLRTTAVSETEWKLDGLDFRLIDVGGQRGERAKWLHHFEGVTAIIFVAALSEYDQVLREDETTNRLLEALNLFREICKSRWLEGVPIILFLNKRDIFQEKIKHTNLNVCFKDYGGSNDYETAAAFIEEKFLAIAKATKTKVYPSVTCATDTDNILKVWDASKEILMRDIIGGLF